MMGLVYYFGVGSYDIDIKRAYAWASVSAKQGRENSHEVAEGYAADLNEQELEEGKRLAEEYYDLFV